MRKLFMLSVAVSGFVLAGCNQEAAQPAVETTTDVAPGEATMEAPAEGATAAPAVDAMDAPADGAGEAPADGAAPADGGG